MSPTDLTNLALTFIVTYGAVAVGAVLLLGAIGLPLPTTFFVLASGAFIQQGVLDLASTAAVAFIAVVIGDISSYSMGHLLRHVVVRRFGQSGGWQRAESLFQRRGALAIYLTRWLLTPIAVPINLVAGSSGYRRSRFIALVMVGELTWLILYGTIGYLVGSQWEHISTLVSDFSGFLVGLVILGSSIYWLLRRPTAPCPD